MDATKKPVVVADFMLYHEAEIRKAVNDERESISFLGASSVDHTGGGKFALSDRTAAAVVQMNEEIKHIRLSDGGRVESPEIWLCVFDSVREEARHCERPQIIFDEWAAKYQKKKVFADYSPRRGALVRQWIRERVLMMAREKGLVSFSDDEIFSSVKNDDDEIFFFSGRWLKRKVG